MEAKNEPLFNNATSTHLSVSKIPIFDMDDLGFFRFYGLGLRHVELELGLKEAVSGNSRGDAVSLACYGHKPSHCLNKQLLLDSTLCESFQEKVEAFILQSYESYHKPGNHYNDAAFELMIREDDARHPYDFEFYPLGKCGSKEFTADKVLSLMTTDTYVNDDVNHAVYNTMMHLKMVVGQLKLQKTNELLLCLEDKSEFQCLVRELVAHYHNNNFLEKPFFLILANLYYGKKLNLGELKDLVKGRAINLMDISEWMQQIDSNTKKGTDTIKVLYQPADLDFMDAQTLSQQLIHFIQYQNLDKVKQCIMRLSKTEFNPDKDNNIQNPLQVAASGESAAILQAVYEFDPNQYESLIANDRWKTPIFIAAYCDRLANLNYLLSVRFIADRDITYFDMWKKIYNHILLEPASSGKPNSYEIMQILITQGVGCGFDIKNYEIWGNPLSVITRVFDDSELNLKKLELLLPHSNAWAKYVSILSATSELYFYYGDGPRKKIDYNRDRPKSLFECRNKVLASLTAQECEEIRTFMISKTKSICKKAEEILVDDLLNFEIKINPESDVSLNISRCFADLDKNEKPSVTKTGATFFYHPAEQPVEITNQQSQKPRYECRIM